MVDPPLLSLEDIRIDQVRVVRRADMVFVISRQMSHMTMDVFNFRHPVGNNAHLSLRLDLSG
jgi:hypothetical protein